MKHEGGPYRVSKQILQQAVAGEYPGSSLSVWADVQVTEHKCKNVVSYPGYSKRYDHNVCEEKEEKNFCQNLQLVKQ